MLGRLEQTISDKSGEGTANASGLFRTNKPILYITVILIAAFGTFAYQLRVESIFACTADGYGSDRYLEYCQATGYGDYDHGAFWFGLEPPARDFVHSAQVLFLGNSRTQFAFSNGITADWFSSRAVPYYLLGFAYSEKYLFEQKLLDKLRPQAKVYVINIDKFFEPSETEPARLVMHDSGALRRYQNKRLWQLIHRPICSAVPGICGHEFAVFRIRETGFWVGSGGRFSGEPVSNDQVVDNALVEREVKSGREFLLRLPVKPECVILTLVPTVGAQSAAARAIAEALKSNFVAPTLDALRTFDGSHLDHVSAERWSQAFFEATGPRIQECLSQPPGSEN
jgi:hypothetical protein